MTGQKYNVGCSTGSLSSTVFIVFLVLKLCKVINWSWWWIISPIWISAGVYILTVTVIAIICTLCRVKNTGYYRH